MYEIFALWWKIFTLFEKNICLFIKNICSFREKYLPFCEKYLPFCGKIFALFENNLELGQQIFRLVRKHSLSVMFTLIASSFESCTATQSWVFFDMQVLKCTFDIIVQTGRYMRRPTQKWYRDYEVINHTISTSRQEAKGWNQR